MTSADDLERQAAAVRRVDAARAAREAAQTEFRAAIVAAVRAGARRRDIAQAAGLDESRVRQILRET